MWPRNTQTSTSLLYPSFRPDITNFLNLHFTLSLCGATMLQTEHGHTRVLPLVTPQRYLCSQQAQSPHAFLPALPPCMSSFPTSKSRQVHSLYTSFEVLAPNYACRKLWYSARQHSSGARNAEAPTGRPLPKLISSMIRTCSALLGSNSLVATHS